MGQHSAGACEYTGCVGMAIDDTDRCAVHRDDDRDVHWPPYQRMRPVPKPNPTQPRLW